MSQVDEVATWAALITGIAGTVLAIVAIWLAIATDDRGRRVNEQMIKSLEKIEAAVERTSADTLGSVKVAWDRLITGGGISAINGGTSVSAQSVAELASGLAAELRAGETEKAEVNESRDEAGDVDKHIEEEVQRRLDEVLPGLADAISRQVENKLSSSANYPPLLDRMVATMRSYSPLAIEVLRNLDRKGHLTRIQYLNAVRSPWLNGAISAIRDDELIAPLRGKDDELVYWFPPNVSSQIRDALKIFSRHDSDLAKTVDKELRQSVESQNQVGERQGDDS